MTNKEIIKYENERLEKIRQELIEFNENTIGNTFGWCVRELGGIIYELETEIKNEKT